MPTTLDNDMSLYLLLAFVFVSTLHMGYAWVVKAVETHLGGSESGGFIT